jgi:hypothetical protein
MIKPSATMRSGFLTNTEEARNNGYAQKTKAAFDTALLFIRGHEFLIREDGCIQNIRRDDEACFGSHFLLDLWLLDRNRRLDVPLQGGNRFFARTSFACVMLRTDQLALHLQPGGESFQFTGQRILRIGPRRAKCWLDKCQSFCFQLCSAFSTFRLKVAWARASPCSVRTMTRAALALAAVTSFV